MGEIGVQAALRNATCPRTWLLDNLREGAPDRLSLRITYGMAIYLRLFRGSRCILPPDHSWVSLPTTQIRRGSQVPLRNGYRKSAGCEIYGLTRGLWPSRSRHEPPDRVRHHWQQTSAGV